MLSDRLYLSKKSARLEQRSRHNGTTGPRRATATTRKKIKADNRHASRASSKCDSTADGATKKNAKDCSHWVKETRSCRLVGMSGPPLSKSRTSPEDMLCRYVLCGALSRGATPDNGIRWYDVAAARSHCSGNDSVGARCHSSHKCA